MLYERDNSLNTAAVIIRERISALPEFAHARSQVVTSAIADCRGRDVAAMQELGGFSAVIRRKIDELPEKYRINYGSTLLPRTVVDTLRDFVPAMREEVQFALAQLTRGALPTVTLLSEDFFGKRFRVEGGDIREDWRESHAKRYPGEKPWCELTLPPRQPHEDHFVGSYCGSVWPMAWPALFRIVDRGTHGQSTYLTAEGVALFGLEHSTGGAR